MMSKRSLRQQTSEQCTLVAMSPGFVPTILADEVNLFFCYRRYRVLGSDGYLIFLVARSLA